MEDLIRLRIIPNIHPMRLSPQLMWALTFLAALPVRATVEQDYLQIYVKLSEFERLDKAGDYKGALDGFVDCFNEFKAIRDANPNWQNVLIRNRLEDCRAKILQLESKAYPGPAIHPVAIDPHDLERFLPRVHTQSYPWKTNIDTAVFWIGENESQSAWNPHWIHDNGGKDTSEEIYSSTNGYAATTHASTVNPFYVALPFNDLAHPDLAAKWLPTGWAGNGDKNLATSVCKDRWIEMKNRFGRVCFAQWEDVGPESTSDASYVFGPNRPASKHGLNISPAVARYLGFKNTGDLSWRFVDDADVRPGMWLRYDEQAILFKAMHEDDKKSSSL